MKALNYLNLLVHSLREPLTLSGPTRIEAIIAGENVIECLETAIEDLRGAGWSVEDLDSFELRVAPAALPTAHLREMYYRALTHGSAYDLPRLEEAEHSGAFLWETVSSFQRNTS